MLNWIKSWWETWRVWASLDPEARAILSSPHDPDDFVEAPRPQ